LSYLEASQENSTRQVIGLAAVLVFHAVLGYALVHGLARKIVEVVTQPLDTKIIEELKKLPQDKPPPPPPPKFVPPPPPYIPPPEVQVQVPVAASSLAITAVTTTKPAVPVAAPAQRVAPPPAPAPRAPVRASAVVDARACDKPEYPPAALRANETGIVLLAFLIDVNGTAVESKIERSSGSRRLDEAALKALGLCRFKPATVDGKPERAWSKIEYEWKLE
jgi:protein TonB